MSYLLCIKPMLRLATRQGFNPWGRSRAKKQGHVMSDIKPVRVLLR